MKIAARITILFLLTAIVPTGIVGYLGYSIGKRTILEETTDHLVSINILKTRELERWVKEGKNSIEELAQRPLVRQYASILAASHERPDPSYRRAHIDIVENHLKPRLKHGVFLELFVMCSPQGHVSASTDENQDGKYRNNRRYFVEGKNRTYVEGSYYSPTLEQPAMTVSTPIKDKDGNTVAVLAGRLNLGELSEIIALQSRKSSTLDTYLVNTFHFFVSEPRFGKDYVLKKAVHTEGIEAGLSGKDGFSFYKNYRGVPVIGAYKWLPELKLCIITEIEQSDAFEPVTHLAWVIAASVFVILITTGLLGIFFARTISRPLIQLAAGAGEIGSGNLEYRIGIRSNDELGDLARATNEMAAKLHETHTSVENLQKEIMERRQVETARKESEGRFRTLFEQAAVGVAEIDTETSCFIRVNRRYCDIVGTSPEEMLETTILAITHPDDIQADLDNIALLKAGKIREFTREKRYIRKDGKIVWVNLSVSAMWAPGESPTHQIAVVQDITERKLDEAALLSLSARQEALLSAIPDIVMEVDNNKIYTWANGAGIEYFGDDVIGREAAYYFEGEQDTYGLVKPLFNGNENVFYVESWQRRRDGEKRLLAWWCRVLKDEDGNVTGALSTAHDITERKHAEEEICKLNAELDLRVQERTAQLEAANKELESFSYSVSHDLRSPLQHITGFAELLNKRAAGSLDEKNKHYLKVITDSTIRMGKLIDDLLAFSRMGRTEMLKKKTNLDSLVKEILRDFQAGAKGRTINWKVSPLPEVYGDSAMLRQVLINLISNAFKFTKMRTDAVIEIGSTCGEKGEECVYVKDNGAGFDMNYVDKLFGIFQRLHRTDEFEGTGIGLANVQRIIHRHGGRVWAEGKVGEGATFYFTLLA
jgi:PAS domain S-box-containing protein